MAIQNQIQNISCDKTDKKNCCYYIYILNPFSNSVEGVNREKKYN